jgi:hypothetical protein
MYNNIVSHTYLNDEHPMNIVRYNMHKTIRESFLRT